MRVSFFGPSPLLANGFYIHNVFGFFFWQRNLVLARENPLTVKWISQFMSFEFNFVTLAGAPALSFFRCGRRHLAHLSGFVLLYWFRSRSRFGLVLVPIPIPISFGLLPSFAVASGFAVWKWCRRFWATTF